MSLEIQILSIGISLLLFGVVFDLVRRKKLAEDYSIFWLAASGVIVSASSRTTAATT